jgi:hypothetical protein
LGSSVCFSFLVFTVYLTDKSSFFFGFSLFYSVFLFSLAGLSFLDGVSFLFSLLTSAFSTEGFFNYSLLSTFLGVSTLVGLVSLAGCSAFLLLVYFLGTDLSD